MVFNIYLINIYGNKTSPISTLRIRSNFKDTKVRKNNQERKE